MIFSQSRTPLIFGTLNSTLYAHAKAAGDGEVSIDQMLKNTMTRLASQFFPFAFYIYGIGPDFRAILNELQGTYHIFGSPQYNHALLVLKKATGAPNQFQLQEVPVDEDSAVLAVSVPLPGVGNGKIIVVCAAFPFDTPKVKHDATRAKWAEIVKTARSLLNAPVKYYAMFLGSLGVDDSAQKHDQMAFNAYTVAMGNGLWSADTPMIDMYRHAYPDVNGYPGWTFSRDNPNFARVYSEEEEPAFDNARLSHILALNIPSTEFADPASVETAVWVNRTDGLGPHWCVWAKVCATWATSVRDLTGESGCESVTEVLKEWYNGQYAGIGQAAARTLAAKKISTANDVKKLSESDWENIGVLLGVQLRLVRWAGK